MKLKIEFDVDNSAFGSTPDESNAEITRILAKVALDINGGGRSGRVIDKKGYRVGQYAITTGDTIFDDPS